MILQELEETEQESDEEGEAHPNETSKKEVAPIELSMNSIVGITRNNTMKVKGKLGGMDMIILIDSGASENFVSFDAFQCLNIFVTSTKSYNVSVGDVYTVKENQKYVAWH